VGLRRVRFAWVAALAVAVVVAVSACGESQQTKTLTVTTSTPAKDATTATSRPKERANSDGGAPVRRHTSTLKACDPNIRVKAATTTCGFAENVFYEYWRSTEDGEAPDVEAYNAEEAATYAASHTVSKGPHDTTDGATSGGDDSDCDPSYEGACLDPSAADYDCEGGSGDGPAYTGTVTVVGDDHFDLDRDGDGIACES
jgi:hypothetical protein